jgi:hypothetical protein
LNFGSYKLYSDQKKTRPKPAYPIPIPPRFVAVQSLLHIKVSRKGRAVVDGEGEGTPAAATPAPEPIAAAPSLEPVDTPSSEIPALTPTPDDPAEAI